MRPILICVFLVGYHAFAPFCGGWDSSCCGETIVPSYYWLGKFLYSFMLETFTFISGYVFAFQMQTLKRDYTTKSLLYNKFKRLIVPSIIFSVLYSFLFYDKPFNLLTYTYDIINGLGHMWFLPMLFWCFVLGWAMSKIRVKESIKIVLLFLLSVFSVIPLPFQLKETCYYLFFFYAASFIYSHKEVIQKRFVNKKTILLVWALFFISFVVLTPLRERIFDDASGELPDKLIRLSLYKTSRLFYSSLGLLSFYLTTLFVLKNGVKVPSIMLRMNELCMGIYLFQQFILKFLYYRTAEPIFFGPYLFLWVGFILALVFSISLTYLVRLSKSGRALV